MKRFFGLFAAALLFALAGAAGAGASDGTHPDVNGLWEGAVQSETTGPSTVTLDITQRGGEDPGQFDWTALGEGNLGPFAGHGQVSAGTPDGGTPASIWGESPLGLLVHAHGLVMPGTLGLTADFDYTVNSMGPFEELGPIQDQGSVMLLHVITLPGD